MLIRRVLVAFSVLELLLGFCQSVALRRHDGYEAPEPYGELNGACFDCSPPVEASPDPLVATTWSPQTNASKLQIYRINQPIQHWVSPPEAAHASLNEISHFHLLVYENCTITLDWGVERAAWFELISSDDLNDSKRFRVLASISEYNEPYPGKTRILSKYGQHTYRLETNNELYEGVRFSFLRFEFMEPSETPIEIKKLSLVAKIKPVNYTGAFLSSDEQLTRAWYTGAYGVRLNMEENDLNSILIERGDRVAIQGDGHPTIDAALVAFSPYSLVRNVLLQSNSAHKHVVDDNIMAYPLYWCLSAMDYFMESGDLANFQQTLASDIMVILDRRILDFLDPNLDITWFGWDDRLGSGWCFHEKGDRCTREALLAFAGLVVRVCQDFARTLRVAGMTLAHQKYGKIYLNLREKLRQVPEWPTGFGVHAAANAINANAATSSEIETWMNSTLVDPVTICSFSQFNQYWILQGLGNADRMEHALASIKLCWGPMMKLGKGCFWELSSPEWLSFMKEGGQAPHLPSYCHPWASGVTAWLSHDVGGIQPLLPGYQKFLATPYVSVKYNFVSATIDTPQGKISVNATLNATRDGDFFYHAVLTSPVPGIFGVRVMVADFDGEMGARLEKLSLNGGQMQMLSDDQAMEQLGDSFHHAYAFQFMQVDAGRTHEVKATYHAAFTKPNVYTRTETKRIPPFPEPEYSAGLAPLDRKSKGDGIFSHGRDGYVLIGCDDNGDDIVRLPSYITNVTIRRHGFPGWFIPEREYIGDSNDNPVHLPIPPSHQSGAMKANATKRALGMVSLDDAGGGDINCVFVDVISRHSTRSSDPFSISVYFVAKSPRNQHAIRVMDWDTLDVIAPTTLMKDFEGGIWWTVRYSKSIRLRLLDVKGIHLSAIAFASP